MNRRKFIQKPQQCIEELGCIVGGNEFRPEKERKKRFDLVHSGGRGYEVDHGKCVFNFFGWGEESRDSKMKWNMRFKSSLSSDYFWVSDIGNWDVLDSNGVRVIKLIILLGRGMKSDLRRNSRWVSSSMWNFLLQQKVVLTWRGGTTGYQVMNVAFPAINIVPTLIRSTVPSDKIYGLLCGVHNHFKTNLSKTTQKWSRQEAV